MWVSLEFEFEFDLDAITALGVVSSLTKLHHFSQFL